MPRTPVSLTRRVVVVSAAVLVLVVAAGAGLIAVALQLQHAQQRQAQLAAAGQYNAELLQAYVDEETGLRGYLLTGEGEFLAPYTAAQTTTVRTMTRLAGELRTARAPAGMGRAVRTAHDAWLGYAGDQIELVQAGSLEQARTVDSTARGKQLFDAIRERDSTLASWLTGAAGRTQSHVAGLQRTLVWLLTGLLVVLAAMVSLGSVVMWRSVARPLARLAAGTRAVAGGDLSADLPAGGAAEVHGLAEDVRAMRNRLTADLHRSRQAIDALEQASPAVAALRSALEPFDEHVPGLVVSARLDPAEGVLAGDWYDTLTLGRGRLALVLGDVAGHGAASAVFALRLKHSLATALRAGLDPGQALTQVSAELVDVPPGQFATVLIAVIDTATDTLVYASAGHPAGLLLAQPPEPDDPLANRSPAAPLAVGDQSLSWIELPHTGPLLSSIVSGWAWNTAFHDFRAGDALLTFTDGVLETRSERGEEFGTAGVLAAIGEVGLADGERAIESIAAASMQFGGNRPRRDDHTLVHVRRSEGPAVQSCR